MTEQATKHGLTKAGCYGIIVAWLVIAAVSIFLIHRTIGWPWGPMVPVAIVIAISGSFFTMMWMTMRDMDAVREDFELRTEEIRSRILPLSVEDARHRAMQQLNDAEKYHCRRSPPTAAELVRLGPEAKRFFSEFESIKGPLTLRRAEICASENAPGCTVIGDLYGDGHTELVAKPGEDRIYLVDLEDPALELQEHAPTIWHCILLETEA